MKKKVVILGGGVAGMSAAHELVERGFNVVVYDTRDIPGGKARSMPVPGSGIDGKKPLPGEHGFRFFPGFYQHITDTMKRIPYKRNAQGVFDNLVDATRIYVPRFDKAGLELPAKVPTNSTDLRLLVDTFLQLISQQAGLKPGEIEYFGHKLWQLITSCHERRIGEYEKIDWWNFVEGDRFSAEYQSLLAKGLTESLVASKAKLASTKTVGDIFLQLILDLVNPTISTDRLLNGPTNEVWIEPWLAHLKSFGVDYNSHSQVETINYADGKIQSATIRDLLTDRTFEVRGDYYISAVPVEVMDRLIIDSNLHHYDPTFTNIRTLAKSVAWMNGIQFYLKEDVPITHGHILLVDTPWALTAISQKQFWPDVDLSEYGDGQVKGILSVDISDWGTDNIGENPLESIGILFGKKAKDCTDEEIKAEVWAQMKKSFNVNGQEILKDENLHSWFLDSDIIDPTRDFLDELNTKDKQQVTIPVETLAKETAELNPEERASKTFLRSLCDLGSVKKIPKENGELIYQSVMAVTSKTNLEPLLVNLVNTWQLRPDAFTRIPNLFLASDYVRTNTDLATMEGANEAARRAVNAILDLTGDPAPRCKIWELHEPEIFAPFRWHDRQRYQQGLPWEDLLGLKRILT
ncbi:FAD-dependent oxidoreductase [Chamaesiphon sp. OTE_75_metabat_556]|uniref:hydroxysqualene dehydroxylase n=1 Tax=Chamaesiphon sp. OTE_75_metabat_556 TaxID=2964692 RepID=UPI00286BD8F9|nr:FAD-dependent oxidoreductase [Chamaesiphon sp. OTE_75_metabat_556]